MNLNGCVNTSQTEKDLEEKKEEYRYVHKHELKPHVSYSPTDGPNSILLVTEVSVTITEGEFLVSTSKRTLSFYIKSYMFNFLFIDRLI